MKILTRCQFCLLIKFVAISETKTKITYKSRHPHIGHVLHLVLNTISSGN